MADPGSVQDQIASLLRPGRLQELDPFLIITLSPSDPYEHVADIGCGPGFFTIPLAKHLIHGKLYALDILDAMLDAMRARVSDANLGNVEVLKCGVTEFLGHEESLDGVFLAFVVHQNHDRKGFLAAVRDLLKPRGWGVVLETYPDTAAEVTPGHRIGPNELEELSREAGYRFQWWRDINGKHYMALLRK